MFTKLVYVLMLIFAIGAGLAATSVLTRREGLPLLKTQAERRSVPDVPLTDTTGRHFTLSEYRGTIVLINFWTTWCKSCEGERSVLAALQDSYRNAGFAVVGIALDHAGVRAVPQLLQSKTVNYRVAYGDDQLAESFGGVSALPTSIFVDRSGKLAAVVEGAGSKRLYESLIRQLLQR